MRDRDDKLGIVIVFIALLLMFNLFYLTVISKHLYYQNRLIIAEIGRINGVVRQLEYDQKPILEFLEKVNEMQKRIEGR